MTTTPNFLWLEAILRHGHSYLTARPDSPLNAQYLDSLVEAQEVFERTRRSTDAAYSKWRHKYFAVIAAHKEVRLVYDAARQQCIEWGLDGFPDHFISYMEEEATQSAAHDMIAFLSDDSHDTDWHEQAVTDLKRAIEAARQAIEAREDEFRHYRARVRERKIGYDRGYALAKELFAAVKPDLDKYDEDWRKLSPYPIT